MLCAYILLQNNVEGDQWAEVYLLEDSFALNLTLVIGWTKSANGLELVFDHGVYATYKSLDNSGFEARSQTQLFLKSSW